jgi:putative phosphoribosyl transferase
MSDSFSDRTEAGQLLAQRLALMRLVDPVVLALPRGGVPVAAEVADVLHAPLDLVIVRKIGAPAQPEFAVAAIAEGMAQPEVNASSAAEFVGADADYIERSADLQQSEIARRRHVYLNDRPPLSLVGRTAVGVDDGVATGATMRAALGAVRRRGPARIVLALPVAPRDVIAALRSDADEVVCLREPAFFRAVGEHYVDFHQVSDGEVIALLARHADRARPASARSSREHG